MLWECKHGHQWEAKLVRINNKKQSWCPKCAQENKVKTNRRFTLEEVIEFAKTNKGKCLSTEYTNNHTKLLWECEYGHQWSATLMNVRNDKTWCPVCDKNLKLDLKEANKHALLNNGKCLSEKYRNKDEKFLWKCAKGHQWLASLGSIKNGGTWCKKCAIMVKKQKYSLLKKPAN